jgi:hypothetical protein
MKAHNTKYLELKNNIIPDLEKSIEDNNEFILVSVFPFSPSCNPICIIMYIDQVVQICCI